MPVVGLNFTHLEAKRGEETPKGEITVNSTPKILEVKDVTLTNLGKKGLSLTFEFLTSYAPNVGEIRLKGSILFLDDKPQDILEKWKKDKALPEEVSVQVLNHLFRRCLIKIATMADDLQLPPPIQLPLVKPKE